MIRFNKSTQTHEIVVEIENLDDLNLYRDAIYELLRNLSDSPIWNRDINEIMSDVTMILQMFDFSDKDLFRIQRSEILSPNKDQAAIVDEPLHTAQSNQ